MMKLSNSFAFTCLCLLLLSCGSQTTTSSPSDFVDGVATALENDGNVDLTAFEWTREPGAFFIDGQTSQITFLFSIQHIRYQPHIHRSGSSPESGYTPDIRRRSSPCPVP